MATTSFIIGEQFEKFVEDELFKATEYDLVYRTNTHAQNESRYAEDTLKPDFKFRHKNTNNEFYIEAKYRSQFNANDKLEVISYNQIERFKTIQSEEKTPIYIAIGYGGYASNPLKVSLIPLNELIYLELYESFLRKFKINKGLVDSQILNLESKNDKKIIDEGKFIIAVFKKKKVLAGLLVGLILTFVLSFNLFNTPIEEKLKQKTGEYYTTIESGDVNELEHYISPTVSKWYSQSNLTYNEIKEQTEAYNSRHPKTKAEIQWDTFRVTPLNDDYSVTYNMIYKLLNENNGKDKIFHLKINAVWSGDLKIKSLYEEKI